ncbi:MAG: hypothetical protein RIR51_1652 [Bacteroidota bacterium]
MRLIAPNFIGIGVMKSATTWISQCLREHPEIYISEIKEIHYFSANYGKGSDWYLKHFIKSAGYSAKGEFSLSYFDDIQYVNRIKADLGNVKILINLRDPVSRFISHIKHIYRVENIPDSHRKYYIDTNHFNYIIQQYPSLLTKGIYYPMIFHCQQVFGEENVLITTKEDIDKDPKKVLELIFKFLEVDYEFEPSILQKNVSIGIIPKYIFLETLRVKLYRYSKQFFPKIILLLRKYRISEIYRKLNTSAQEISLDKNVIKLLYQYYWDDLELINNKLHINTTNWKYNENKN